MSLSWGSRGSLAVVALAALFLGLVLVGVGRVSVAGAVGSCPNEGFRTGPSAALPDCRAYEMVSPADKNGGEVDGGVSKGAMAAPEQAAADGEAVTYGSTSAFVESDPTSAVATSQYLSRRTAGGWQTREIVPKQEIPNGKLETLGQGIPDFSLFQGFNEELSGGFLLAWNPQPDPAAPVGYFNPYLFNGLTGGYQVLSTVEPQSWPTGQAELETGGFGSVFAGMSADGQHVIFEANDALTERAIPGQVNLYEWSAGRPLELVSELPDGAVDSYGGKHPLAVITGSNPLRFGSVYNLADYSGALSSDGRRAFWSGGPPSENQIYMHEITGSGSRSVDVSASQKSGEPNAAADYWTASSEGSRVYFTSSGRLTGDSTASAGSPDLYQYDVDSGELLDLSVDRNRGEAADVLGVLGTGESENVSYVYFVARGNLAEGAVAGAANLYAWRGGESEPRFIASLGEFEGEQSNYAQAVTSRTSRVSPSGRLLAFQSAKPLTGYDNRASHGQPCPDPANNDGEYHEFHPYEKTFEGRCMEVYEYDAQSGKLVCASCEPDGLPPTADSLLPETLHQYEEMRGWESTTVQQRYLLDDGRLFFTSEDALLAQATDGKQNVYEYEPEGIGQCAAAGAGGCVYLISTGEGTANSYFADASADGRDVFILTNQQLVPQDTDGGIDVYDAREGGGFSSATPPPCSGEACKPAVTPAPAIYGAPSSATFQGVGDTPPAPAAKPTMAKKKIERPSKRKSTKHKRKVRAKRAGKSVGKSGRRSERSGR